MLKKINLVGIIIGIVIMACSYFAFTYDISMTNPNMSKVVLTSITAPDYESNKSYGGDAYTGIQQAAAQTANNLIPVFEAIEENNYAIAALNTNNIAAANAEVENTEAVVSMIQYFVGFIMLAIGLTVISKSVEIELSFRKKEIPIQTIDADM